MSVRLRNLSNEVRWAIENAGIMPGIAAKKAMVYSSATAAPYVYWAARGGGAVDSLYSTIDLAHTGTTSSRNDVVLLTPESHTQTASVTWSNSMTHFVGMYGPALLNQRSRIGHNANYSPMFTLSGSGNTWANLYFMYGRGSATNLILLSITGSRNSFMNCHFGSPMHATEGDEATLVTVNITGQENYFNNCVLGIDTIARSAANTVLKTGSGSARNVFDDCIFLSMSDAASPFQISVAAGSDRYSIFRNCMFLNFSADWGSKLTYLVTKATTTDSYLIFDGRCMTFGIADIIAAARVGEVWWGGATNTSNVVGLSINPAET